MSVQNGLYFDFWYASFHKVSEAIRPLSSDPETIHETLFPFLLRFGRVDHEAGSVSLWLHPELKKLGLPAICLETVNVRAAMSAQHN